MEQLPQMKCSKNPHSVCQRSVLVPHVCTATGVENAAVQDFACVQWVPEIIERASLWLCETHPFCDTCGSQCARWLMANLVTPSVETSREDLPIKHYAQGQFVACSHV